MQTFLLSLLTLVVVVQGKAPVCMDARNRCVTHVGCSMALTNFHIACEKVKLGLIDHCTDACMRAVVSLVTVDQNIGTDYLTCDCAGNQDCDLWKERITMCSTDVLRALESLDNEDVISCSLARMLCDADTQCWTALMYYEKFCSNLWVTGMSYQGKQKQEVSTRGKTIECSPRCNNSLSILYRQTRAAKLKNCLCDDADPFVDKQTCIRMRYNTQKSCFGEEPSKPIVAADHAMLMDVVQLDSSSESGKSDNAATGYIYSSKTHYTTIIASLIFLALLLTVT